MSADGAHFNYDLVADREGVLPLDLVFTAGIHEQGDCSAPDASSAGGHFNPSGASHGSPMAPDHHAGDLGSLCVDGNGAGHLVILMPDLTVANGPHAVRNHAIVVHEQGDDFVTQPTGNSGARIGCGVIH